MKTKLLSEMPENLSAALGNSGIQHGEILAVAFTDTDEKCNWVDGVLILCKDSLIYAKSCSKVAERLSTKHFEINDYSDFKFSSFSVSDIKDPMIVNLVVGGILKLTVNGSETALCGFTNNCKGRVHKLCDILRLLIDEKEIPENKLSEEVHDDVCPKCGTPYPNIHRKVCPKCMDKRKIFFRLASFFKPFKVHIIIISVLCILNALMSSLWPLLNGTLLYDGVLAKNNSIFPFNLLSINDFALLLLILALTMAGAKLLQQIFGMIQGLLVAKIVPSVVCTIKSKVFQAIQYLSVSFFSDKQTGGLMSRITHDATRVSDIFLDGIPFILPNLFTIIFSSYVMFSTNWILAITAIATLPPAIIISMKLEPLLWHYNSKMFQSSRSIRAKLNDNITGARVVKAFGREESEVIRLKNVSEYVAQTQTDSMKFDIKFSALYQLSTTLSSLFTWAIGACFVLAIFKPQISYGTLITFTGYVSLLAGPADFFSYIFRWWSASMNSAQRIFEILDAKPDVVEKANPIRPQKVNGNIKLEQVSFAYEENHEILKDISLEISEGKMLGIVGKSGAGKTTLVNLISRLYDTTSGNIYIDGINIRDMSFEDIRKNVALVSQETYIFKGTIFDNIAYANPSADRKAVIEAAIAASAHDFICALPDGYDTPVGSGSRSLSGGEKQRVSIARAILANPKILILDEATAAVDTETEKNIQSALDKLIVGRTTISIAHRLSTLRNADTLIVIENGRIVESGTHDKLIRQKGAYYKLLQIQNKALAMRGIGD